MAMGDLTTLAIVRARLQFAVADTEFDTLISALIGHVSDNMQDRMGRICAETTYTDYYDGTGTDTLLLRQGPLVSVTSVHEVSYDDDGLGARTETLTELVEADRLEGGLYSEGHLGLGEIRRLGGVFSRGKRNWKVVHKSGFTTLPDGLVKVATEFVVAEFFTRETKGYSSKSIGDGQSSVLTPVQLDMALERAIKPYRILHVA